jgi:hypothetical protein
MLSAEQAAYNKEIPDMDTTVLPKPGAPAVAGRTEGVAWNRPPSAGFRWHNGRARAPGSTLLNTCGLADRYSAAAKHAAAPPATASGSDLDGCQGLVQICNDVFHILDTHGDAHHAVG